MDHDSFCERDECNEQGGLLNRICTLLQRDFDANYGDDNEDEAADTWADGATTHSTDSHRGFALSRRNRRERQTSAKPPGSFEFQSITYHERAAAIT